MKAAPDQTAVAFRQLCAIARAVYSADIDDAEWSARIKDRLSWLGFGIPYAEHVTAAMRAIGHVDHRPPPMPHPPGRRLERAPDVRPLTRDEATALIEWLNLKGIIRG